MYLHGYYMISAEIGPVSVDFDMSGGVSLQVGVQFKVTRLCAQARWCRCLPTSTCVFHYTCAQMLLKHLIVCNCVCIHVFDALLEHCVCL